MNQSKVSKTAMDLIYLVSCAFNSITPDAQRCSEMDDAAVYSMASSHMLSAAAAYAIEKVSPLSQRWLNAKGNSKRRLIIFQAERAKILREFDRHGIWYLPLKGILLKDIYPEASMREMSDNDILCDASKMSEIRDIMCSLGFTCVEFGNHNHDVYSKKPVSFEIHAHLFNPITWPTAYSYYSTLKERLIKDDDNRCGYHMTDEDFYVYCVIHMYKHFSHAGTGLRSLADVYLFNKAKGQSLDREYIRNELEFLGIREYEAKTRELAEKVFSFQPLSDSDKEELAFYADSGSYGTVDNMIKNRLGGDNSKKAKLRYIISRVFPSKEHLEQYHPVVYRHRVLYPLLVVYRPFNGLIRHRKKLFNEVDSLRKKPDAEE